MSRGLQLFLLFMAAVGFTLSARFCVGRDLPLFAGSAGLWAVLAAGFAHRAVGLLRGRYAAFDVAALAALVVVAARFEIVARNGFMPQVVSALVAPLLIAWAVALHTTRDRPPQEQHRVAYEAICGVFGALMLLAALSKAANSGLAWFTPRPHLLTVLERLTLQADPGGLRALFVEQPLLVAFGAGWTFVVEALGVLFLWPRLRKPYALLNASMFLGLAVVVGVVEPLPLMLSVALAWGVRPEAASAAPPSPASPSPPAGA